MRRIRDVNNENNIKESLKEVMEKYSLSHQELMQVLDQMYTEEMIEKNPKKFNIKKTNVKKADKSDRKQLNETITEEFQKNVIEYIKEISGKGLGELEEILRPGRASMDGFLGIRESLIKRIMEDFHTCQILGIAHNNIASEIQKIIKAFENREKTYITSYGEELKIGGASTKGSQNNPFTKDGSPRSSYMIFVEKGDEKVTLTEMHPWLIGELCFFQGKNMTYRIDPERFAKMIGLIK